MSTKFEGQGWKESAGRAVAQAKKETLTFSCFLDSLGSSYFQPQHLEWTEVPGS